MRRPPPGRYITVSTAGEPFKAFVPTPLPPDPPIAWSPALRTRFDDARVALGWLDAITALLPNAALVLYSFVRKEAVLSSQIEGTQSSRAWAVRPRRRWSCILQCSGSRSRRRPRWSQQPA